MYVCVCTHTCLIHAVPFRALQLWFLSLYITFFLSFCVCFSFSPSPFVFLLLFVFWFSLYLLPVLLTFVPMPRPPLWHHGWLCPIRSAAGEGGEWDAGSSESGASSHHTVLRPWNVSGTTTKKPRRVSPPFSLPPENYHTETSLYLPGANSAQTISQDSVLIDK